MTDHRIPRRGDGVTQTPLPSLDAEIHALQLRAATALRAWRDAPLGEGVAEMREAANCILDAREQFQTSDGATDWTGRSSEYRQFHRGVINLAAKDSAEAKAMQDTLRWHVQHQRAKRLTRDELRSIGLRPDTPNERAVAREREAARPLPTRDEIADELAGWPIGSGYYSWSVPVDEAQAMADAVLALLRGAVDA